ncbi:MAG TPA: ParB/RepB/Spo0J family partition protein [Gemmatimonadales bacterium]|jgi:ParB family chromosome partitioning protein|nr:ParB/RepB/Spo0J family partition protein [Gemmatimonadales bacterium]
MTQTRRLGRGLEALLGPTTREQAEREGTLQELAVSAIRRNPFQPRVRFDEAGLAQLAASIQSAGLLQPVIVRPVGDGYELIAGERRWRAVQRLGWARIPAVVRPADDRTLLTLALVENLQRDDLNPIEAATSYQRLMDEFEASQAEVAQLVGKDRSTVANALRLLRLPPEIRSLVEDSKLTEGHARALLSLADERDMLRLARAAVASEWSVRQIEARVRLGRNGAAVRRAIARNLLPEHRRVEDALRKRLGTDVRLTPRRRGRGFLTVNFYSNEDLARLLELILGEPYQG